MVSRVGTEMEKTMKRLWTLFVALCALASIVYWPDAKAQDVYLLDFPEAKEHVDYALWAVNERAGFRAEFAGEADQACQPGIVVREASAAEWPTHNVPASAQAFTATCPLRGAYQVVWKPGVTPTRSLMLHELGGHAMGCWRHIPLTAWEQFFNTPSRHAISPYPTLWAALTVEDVDCILEGDFWPRYQEPDLCFTELLPNFDLIAPSALGHYTRLEFVGNALEGRYEWKLGTRVAGSGECDSVRIQGGQIVLDDVRSQGWRGSAVIAPDGLLWRLVMAIPH